jgi:hypothetical protein
MKVVVVCQNCQPDPSGSGRMNQDASPLNLRGQDPPGVRSSLVTD